MNHTIETCINAWQQKLASIESQPLSLCPSFPEVARQWNDWWAFKADRPLIIATAPGTRDIRWDKAFDLLDEPAEWLRVRRRQTEETHWAGEALPAVRVDIGPVAMAAFMGAPLHLAPEEQTTWQDPTIETWSDEVRLALDPENRWLSAVMTLMRVLADDARGNYLVCLPDLTGPIDAIANMRGSEQLCFDLYESREHILRAAGEAVDAWTHVFAEMYNTVLGAGAGITQWIPCWANSPFTVPTCDFNALIGPDDFKDVCMPAITDQARRAGLCVFHLDGPDAARHAETLAADPDITAVQYTPGAGSPSALAKLPMFRILQEHKTPLFIECPKEEVRELAQALDPRGVAIRAEGIKSPQEADELVAWRDSTFG